MNDEKEDQGVVVQITHNFTDITLDISNLENLVKVICDRFQINNATISIAIVGDAEIMDINNKFLNKNSTTDCLSFDLSDSDQNSVLFDLMVNAEMAIRQANSRSHSSQAELALYITHGLLHNLGFDDSTQPLAKKMHDTENEILQQQGFGSVYNP